MADFAADARALYRRGAAAQAIAPWLGRERRGRRRRDEVAQDAGEALWISVMRKVPRILERHQPTARHGVVGDPGVAIGDHRVVRPPHEESGHPAREVAAV